MDSDGLPLIGSGVDLTKIGAIHQKRMLAFLNHFITHSTRFLNKFSCVCEQKLTTLNTRIQRLEITMNILEAKIASIPGLENVQAAVSPPPPGPTPQQPNTDLPALPPSEAAAEGVPAIEAQPEAPAMTVSQDPRYAKYFKMVNMGVPAVALKQKLLSDGLDPDYLDKPNAPAPPMPQDDDSDSDFTDSETDSDEHDFSD